MPKNPVREFFRRIKSLREQCQFAGIDEKGVHWAKRVAKSDCTGTAVIGISREKTWLTDKEGDEILWQLSPRSYHGRGKPLYTPEKLVEMLKESTTEKKILRHTHEGKAYDFVWRWDHWERRGPDYWGVAMGPLFYEVRRGKRVVLRAETKKELHEWWMKLTVPGWEPKVRVRKPQHPARYPKDYRGVYGSPWAERLCLQVVSEGSLYPALKSIYGRLAPEVAAGKTEYDFWEEFMPVVERHVPECVDRYKSYFELTSQKVYIPIQEQRHAAWMVAERFRAECQINPQYYISARRNMNQTNTEPRSADA